MRIDDQRNIDRIKEIYDLFTWKPAIRNMKIIIYYCVIFPSSQK